MKSVLRWCVVPLLAGMLMAQPPAKPKPKKAAAKLAQPAVTLQDIQALKDALAAQQQQIEQLKQAVQQKDQAWQQAQQQLQQARPPPATRRTKPQQLRVRPIARKTPSSSWTATWPM